MTLKVAVRFILSQMKPIAILWMVTVPVVASAHHSFNFYALGELTEIEGELLSVSWKNPHIYLTVKSRDEDGFDVLYNLATGSVYALTRRGIERDLFQPGERIKAAGRMHTRAPEMWVHNLLLADGREVIVNRTSDPRWNFDAIGWTDSTAVVDISDPVVDTVAEDEGIFRVWSEPLTRGITFHTLPYWEEPPTRGLGWLATQNEYNARCEAMGMPETMGTPHPLELIDHGSTIGMFVNGANSLYERIFHITDQEDPAEQPLSPFGYSVGNWEDDNTLVVETTRVHMDFDISFAPQTDDVKFVEIFTLSEDQSRLGYVLTVTDPEILRQPTDIIDKNYVALGESLVVPTDCPD